MGIHKDSQFVPVAILCALDGLFYFYAGLLGILLENEIKKIPTLHLLWTNLGDSLNVDGTTSTLTSIQAESYLFTHQPIITQFLKPQENVNGYGMDSSLGVLALAFLISISPYVHKLFIDIPRIIHLRHYPWME